jgi:hypothetical protein
MHTPEYFGKLAKDHINNKGYKKYLKLKEEVKVELDVRLVKFIRG